MKRKKSPQATNYGVVIAAVLVAVFACLVMWASFSTGHYSSFETTSVLSAKLASLGPDSIAAWTETDVSDVVRTKLDLLQEWFDTQGGVQVDAFKMTSWANPSYQIPTSTGTESVEMGGAVATKEIAANTVLFEVRT